MCVFSRVRLFRLLLVLSETNVTIAAAPTFTMPVFLRVIYNVCQSIICFVFPAHFMLWTVNNVFPFLRNNACFFLAISLVVCTTHVALLDSVSIFLNVVVLFSCISLVSRVLIYIIKFHFLLHLNFPIYQRILYNHDKLTTVVLLIEIMLRCRFLFIVKCLFWFCLEPLNSFLSLETYGITVMPQTKLMGYFVRQHR